MSSSNIRRLLLATPSVAALAFAHAAAAQTAAVARSAVTADIATAVAPEAPAAA